MSNIISIDDLTSYIGKPLSSGQLQPCIDAVNSWIENRTHRCFGETKQVTQRYDYKQVVYLRHQDVVSVDEITLGFPGLVQTTLPAESYFVNDYGRVTLIASLLAPHVGNLDPTSRLLSDFMAITYTYGVEEVPDDLKLAALGIAAGYYNWSINGQKDIVSAGVGSYRLQYSGAIRGGSSGPDTATSTADALFSVVESYRTRRV